MVVILYSQWSYNPEVLITRKSAGNTHRLRSEGKIESKVKTVLL